MRQFAVGQLWQDDLNRVTDLASLNALHDLGLAGLITGRLIRRGRLVAGLGGLSDSRSIGPLIGSATGTSHFELRAHLALLDAVHDLLLAGFVTGSSAR